MMESLKPVILKCGPAATTHGNLLEMPNSHPKTIESETLRVGQAEISVSTSSSVDSDAIKV